MFTGIVRELGSVFAVEDKENARQLTVQFQTAFCENLVTGASIAILGCCLTVTLIRHSDEYSYVDFYIMKETLDKTNLGQLKVSSLVNAERSVKFGEEIGGHNVSGHIDCVGKAYKITVTPNNCEILFQFEKEWGKFVIPKGYISVNGVSLTVCLVFEDGFSVNLIPETLERTNLGKIQVGDPVNLEFENETKTIVLSLERILPRMLPAYLSGQISNSKDSSFLCEHHSPPLAFLTSASPANSNGGLDAPAQPA
eukprot:Sdes_comp18680_c0_seq2m8940